MSELKIELKREEKKYIVSFYVVFKPETVEEALLLKELEKELRYNPISKWDDKNFIVYLT